MKYYLLAIGNYYRKSKFYGWLDFIKLEIITYIGNMGLMLNSIVPVTAPWIIVTEFDALDLDCVIWDRVE